MNKLNKKEVFLTDNDLDRCRNVIRELLFKNDINVSELARAINLPQPTIQRLVSGKTVDPKLSTLTLIANHFSLTIDQLLGNATNNSLDNNTAFKVCTAPIISWEQAAQFKKFLNSTQIKDWKDWIAVDINISSSIIFGLKTKPSMEPRFITGSILTIDTEKKPVDGDLVIVCYPDTIEATIREIILDGPKHEIRSITDKNTETLTENIKLIGIVVQTRYSY